MTQFIPQFAKGQAGEQAGTAPLVEPPVKGMREIPYGFPQMAGAWVGCVSWALSVPEMRDRFKAETGQDINAIAGASGLDQMIDEATGRTRDVLVAWCDWVTVNVWGPAVQLEELRQE